MSSTLHILRAAHAVRHPAVLGAYDHWAQTLRRCGGSLAPAVPGTVHAYDQHLLVEPIGMAPADWPKTVERTPAILAAFAALAKHKDDITGTVKVTAYASPGRVSSNGAESGRADAMLFPAGVQFVNLRPEDFDAVVATYIRDTPPEASARHAGTVAELRGLNLFVCSHATRDARCGKFGPPLARRLRTVAQQRGFGDVVRVFECSHVGGHKYAGNVLVYGGISPNEGDWFGGVTADDAEQLLTALTEIEVGSEGGFDHPVLRRWWRGRMGLTKDQQKQCFEQCALCGDGSGDEEDFSDVDADLEIEDVEPRRMQQQQ